MFSVAHRLTDAYTMILVVTAPIPLAIALAATAVRPPVLTGDHPTTSTDTPT